MAEATLVKDQAVEGGMLIQKLRENQLDVSGACWLLDSERDRWILYIVTKALDETEGGEARRILHAAFEQLPDLWLDSSEVRLIRPSERIAKEIAAIQSQGDVKLKRRHHIKLGGIEHSADVHVYPLQPQLSPVQST